MTLLPLMLAGPTLGLSPTLIGGAFGLQSIISVFGAVPMANVADRVGMFGPINICVRTHTIGQLAKITCTLCKSHQPYGRVGTARSIHLHHLYFSLPLPLCVCVYDSVTCKHGVTELSQSICHGGVARDRCVTCMVHCRVLAEYRSPTTDRPGPLHICLRHGSLPFS